MSHTTDTTESLRALGRRFFAEQDRLRGGPAEAMCTPDYEAHLGGHATMGRAGHEGFAQAFYAGVPDMHHEVEEVLVDPSGRVAVRFTLHGTHTGSLFGIPATGKRLRIVANVLLHVEASRVRKLQGVFDEAGMLRQLGVLPD